MDVDWSEDTNQWVAVGNKGKWIKFSADLTQFDSRNLSDTDLTSHTELAIDGDVAFFSWPNSRLNGY